MEANKKTINLIKNSLKGMISTNNDRLEELKRELYNYITRDVIREDFIAFLRDNYGSPIKYTADEKAVICAAYDCNCEIEKENKILELMNKNLGKEGFIDKVYSLPFFAVRFTFKYVAVVFLILTGIKMNATKKSNFDSLMDDMERDLWSLESRMAKYIKDDFTIDTAHLVEFLDLMQEYLVIFKKRNTFYELSDTNMDEAIESFLATTLDYVLFCEDAYEKDVDELEDKFRKSRIQNSDKSSGEVLKDIYEEYIEKMPKPTIDTASTEDFENKESLDDYVKDGQIIKLCRNLESFRSLLETSSWPKRVQEYYSTQMGNLIDISNETAYRNKIREYRNKILSEEDRSLYELLSGSNLIGRPYIKDGLARIDEYVEMLVQECTIQFAYIREELGETVLGIDDETLYQIAKNYDSLSRFIHYIEEAVDLIKEDICTILRQLWVKKSASSKDIVQAPQVVYYADSYENADGRREFIVPRFLRRVLEDRDNSSILKIQLESIMEGQISDDRELRKRLPYQVFVKGREVKIFYTYVDGVIVIIDAQGINGCSPVDNLKSEGGEYTQVMELVRSENFKVFIEQIKENITKGKKPNASNYTKMIFDYLDGRQMIMKKRGENK